MTDKMNVDPELLEKVQNDPRFAAMMKALEEQQRYENMTPKEKLRAKLVQKQAGRMNSKVKEANETEQPRKHGKKIAKIPKTLNESNVP